MSNDSYQGWANRETWCVALWLDNEQTPHEACRMLAQEAADAYEAADRIERYVENMIVADGMQLGLINCCLARCDWAEIADHFRAE
jgi:hypothetical protein